jgi:hypothetical protein
MADTKTVNCWIWTRGTPIFSLSYTPIDHRNEFRRPSDHPKGSNGLSDHRNEFRSPSDQGGANPRGREVYTDITAYRPDPRTYLDANKPYVATLTFVADVNHLNEDIWVLRKIVGTHGPQFNYIR